MREPAGMARLGEDDRRRPDARGEVVLQGRVNHPVEVRHCVPRGQRVPGDRSGGLEEQPEARRALLVTQPCGRFRVEIRREVIPEELGCDEARRRERLAEEGQVPRLKGCRRCVARAEADQRLPRVRHESRRVDEAEDVGATCGRLRDDRSTVRVADEDLVAGDSVEGRLDDGDVGVAALEPERGRASRKTVPPEAGGHLVPAGRSGPRAVDEDDRRAAGGVDALGQRRDREQRNGKQSRQHNDDHHRRPIRPVRVDACLRVGDACAHLVPSFLDAVGNQPTPAVANSRVATVGPTKRRTNANEMSATSRQPESIVSEWPRPGIFVISVTLGLPFCCL